MCGIHAKFLYPKVTDEFVIVVWKNVHCVHQYKPRMNLKWYGGKQSDHIYAVIAYISFK